MNILVTGGAGYIGSHTVLELLKKDVNVVLVDNLINSSKTAVKRIEHLTSKSIKFYDADIRDYRIMRNIFIEHKITHVIHFAGLKSVSESLQNPHEYYDCNVNGTICLLKIMTELSIKNFIFSSSATVYGSPKEIPLTENSPVGATTNPYGTSKYMVEEILEDIFHSNQSMNITILRYFNPVGAHPSGMIGEDPAGTPNNLLPYITQVAIGKLKQVNVFGDDYSTVDGSGVRDYVHVQDLAQGHLAAIFDQKKTTGLHIYNLGTGKGYSVFELIKAFERVNSCIVHYKITARRPGDVAECWADVSKAKKELGWEAKKNITDMVRDAWRWQVKNPNGYK